MMDINLSDILAGPTMLFNHPVFASTDVNGLYVTSIKFSPTAAHGLGQAADFPSDDRSPTTRPVWEVVMLRRAA